MKGVVREVVRGAVEHMILILVTEWSAIVTDVFVMIIILSNIQI